MRTPFLLVVLPSLITALLGTEPTRAADTPVYSSDPEIVRFLLERGVAEADTVGPTHRVERNMAAAMGYTESARALDDEATERRAVGVAGVRSFVYHWFVWLDRREGVERFTEHLSRLSCRMILPGADANGPVGFERWYGGFRDEYEASRHVVGRLQVRRLKNGDYVVTGPLTRRLYVRAGPVVAQHLDVSWLLRVGSDGCVRVRRLEMVPAVVRPSDHP